MARKDDAPAISLFSFQDIITSLTGIMFLIVLLLILFMLEMRPKAELAAARQERQVISGARTELEQLRRRLAELRKNEAELNRRIAELQKDDLPQVRRKIEQAQNELDALRGEVVPLREALKKAQERIRLALARSEELNRRNRQLQEASKAEQKRIDELRRVVQRSRVRAEQLKRTVRYTVENSSTLAPVLAECSKTGIRLLDCATGKRIDLSCGDGSAAARQQAFLDYLGKRNTQGEYYTILVKPETFEDAVLVERLKDLGIARGLELLPDNELTIFGGQ